MISKFANKSFFLRLGSGIGLIAMLLLTIIPGGKILFFTSLLLSMIGVFELYRVFGIETNTLGLTGYAFTFFYYVLVYFGKVNEGLLVISFFAVFTICLLAQFVFFFPKYKTQDISNTLLGMFYAGILLSHIFLVRTGVDGKFTVWLIFLCSWGSDTFAYVAGVAFGKHKMAPVLSPKKSIEGAVGGVIGAAVLGAVYAAIFSDKLHMPGNVIVVFAVICAVGALISMVGDLAASAIKRNYEIKDYSNLIPGHGGIMDRFDSVIYVAPIICLLLAVVHRFM